MMQMFTLKSTILSSSLTLYRIKLKVLTKVPLLSFTAIAAEDLENSTGKVCKINNTVHWGNKNVLKHF